MSISVGTEGEQLNMNFTKNFGFGFIVLTFAGSFLLNQGSSTNAQSSNPSGRFFVNIQSGKCIDVSGAPGRTTGSKLQLWDCELSGLNPDNNSPSDQRWMITNDGFIRNTLSGKCIDVAGAPGAGNGSPLQLWDCELSGRNRDNGSLTDQRWTITSDGFIMNTLSQKCIDVAGAPGQENGSQLQLWDCERTGRNQDNGSPTDQTWRLE